MPPNILSPPTSPLDAAKYKNLTENDGELEYPASLGSKRYLANTSCDDNDFNFTTRSELSDTESSEAFKEQIEINENDENESNVQQEIRSLPEDDTDDEQNKERDSSVPPQVESVVSHESLMDAYITEARRKAEELKEKSRFMLLDTPSL